LTAFLPGAPEFERDLLHRGCVLLFFAHDMVDPLVLVADVIVIFNLFVKL
jgi:hypothetical protein